MTILFVGKENDHNTEQAAQYLKTLFPETYLHIGVRTDPFPTDELKWLEIDYIFSYLCPWVIPEVVLKQAKKAAINWHPGPPEYPGIGCTNFAIYEGAKTYGISCHHMAAKVDTGKMIQVRRFPIHPKDTVYTITQKCYAHALISFYEITDKIFRGEALPECEETWTKKPTTRKQLDELCYVDPKTMSEKEIKKRIKATTYDKPWAFTVIHGKKFYLKDNIFDPNS